MAKIMPNAAALRRQIEEALAEKIPSALTPAPKVRNAVTATGITALDELLQGGLPQGAVSELVGPECSGRTSIALSFIAKVTQAEKCVRVDRCIERSRSSVSGGGRSGPETAALGALRSRGETRTDRKV